MRRTASPRSEGTRTWQARGTAPAAAAAKVLPPGELPPSTQPSDKANTLLGQYGCLGPRLCGAFSAPFSSRVLGSLTQGHGRDRDCRAVFGITQVIKATSATLFWSACKVCSKIRKPKSPAPQYQSSGAIFLSDCHLSAIRSSRGTIIQGASKPEFFSPHF